MILYQQQSNKNILIEKDVVNKIFSHRGVIQSFVEKHFPTSVEQSKPMSSIFDLIPSNEENHIRSNKKRKSTHHRTIPLISCDTDESSDDSDIERYSSFVQTNKRRTTTKHRDQNNNNQLHEIHNSDNENSCESILIEDSYSQQHTFAEILGQTDTDSGLPVKRIQKKDISSNLQNCKKICLSLISMISSRQKFSY